LAVRNFRKSRKVSRVETCKLKRKCPGSHLDAVFLATEIESLRGKRTNEVEKNFSIDRRPTFVSNSGGTLREDRNIKVGSGKMQAITLGGKENVGENRNGCTTFDDALNELDFIEECGTVESQVHAELPPTVRHENKESIRIETEIVEPVGVVDEEKERTERVNVRGMPGCGMGVWKECGGMGTSGNFEEFSTG